MNKAIDIIKHFESLHDGDLKTIGLQPKMCPAGIWTGGYGHAFTDPATGKFLKGEEDKARACSICPGLTEEAADLWLEDDYNRFELSVKALLKQPATPYELGAMTSLAYNIGIGSFRDSSVLRFFNKGDKETAAESFKLWVKCNGKVLRGLELRRAAEVHLFKYNEVKF
jgi:lysozyme